MQRYVLTHITAKNERRLTLPAQGRCTWPTAEEASAMRDAILTNNAPERLASVYGPRFVDTVRVQAVECWDGHHDPKCTVFEDD